MAISVKVVEARNNRGEDSAYCVLVGEDGYHKKISKADIPSHGRVSCSKTAETNDVGWR